MIGDFLIICHKISGRLHNPQRSCHVFQTSYTLPKLPFRYKYTTYFHVFLSSKYSHRNVEQSHTKLLSGILLKCLPSIVSIQPVHLFLPAMVFLSKSMHDIHPAMEDPTSPSRSKLNLFTHLNLLRRKRLSREIS